MRITVNLAEDVVKHLDTSAEAHHESRAEYAGMLIESTLTSQNKILARYAEELTQRDTIIKRQTDEIQGLRRLLDEARGEAQKKSAILEGESEPVIAAKNLRIEELSASVARLEEELARAPAAGDVARLENDVADLRARVQEQDVQVARLEEEREGAAPLPDQGTVPGEESARPGEVQRLLDVIARVRRELAVAETKIAAQERVIEDAQRREEVWRDLIYQEKGERRALLERIPLLPAPKEGFWSRIFRGRGG